MNNIKIILISFIAGIFGGILALYVFPISLITEEHTYIEESDGIETIDQVMPAVVSIKVSKDVPFDVGFEAQEISGGTGFIVSAEGLILTNKHVLEGGIAEYKVIMNDGTEYSAELVSEDPFDDIAVLKIVENGLNLPTVKFGNSDALRIGQRVFAVGNALALYGNTVTSGIISAKGREMGENLSGLIQTDAAINFGNSGGPLVNMFGEVVGMNTAVAEYADNIGFAIPVNDLDPVLKSIEKYGEIIRPVLGVKFIMLTEAQAKELDGAIDHGAILVASGFVGETAISPGGAAEEAGLKELDVILSVDGVEIDIKNPLHKVIRNYNPGDKVKMKVWRNGEELDVIVELGNSKDL